MTELKKCEICQITENEKPINKVHGIYMCPKHKAQFYRYGKIVDSSQRTVADRNEIFICGDIAKLILRNKNNTIQYVAIIDTEDVNIVSQYKWRFDKNNNAKSYGNVVAAINGKRVALHRFVLNYTGNLEIDHINRDTLDNRKENLRIVTRTENMHNLPGLGIFKEGNRWRVQLRRYNKKYSVGSYTTYEEALDARNMFLENFDKKVI